MGQPSSLSINNCMPRSVSQITPNFLELTSLQPTASVKQQRKSWDKCTSKIPNNKNDTAIVDCLCKPNNGS